MAFYFYHNPEVNPHLTIHKSKCGHCNNGKGKGKKKEKGRYGVWSGEFDQLQRAIEYINTSIILNGYEISFCKRCKPKNNPTLRIITKTKK